MMITTTDFIPGKRITEVLGVCRGNTIRARHVGKDILAGLKTLVGGEIQEYTKLIGEAREQAIDRMMEEGRAMGADAIISVRFGTSYIMGTASEILAYGTGVKLTDDR